MQAPYNWDMPLWGHLYVRRIQLRLSQTDAGERVGVSQSKWSHWEDGSKPVPTKDYPAVAKFLGVSVAEIADAVFGRSPSEVRFDAVEAEVHSAIASLTGWLGTLQELRLSEGATPPSPLQAE